MLASDEENALVIGKNVVVDNIELTSKTPISLRTPNIARITYSGSEELTVNLGDLYIESIDGGALFENGYVAQEIALTGNEHFRLSLPEKSNARIKLVDKENYYIIYTSKKTSWYSADNKLVNEKDNEVYVEPKPYGEISGNWKLTFRDEFNGVRLDMGKWNMENSLQPRDGRGGIGVKEWYWRPENVSVKDGNLVLKVYKAADKEKTMYCGCASSNRKFLQKYGYFEARVKVGDLNYGTHTAFWLMPQKIDDPDHMKTADDGAEIDVFESAYHGDFTYAVIHYDGYGAHHRSTSKKYGAPGIHNGFHVYGVEWTPETIKIYYDGVLKATFDNPNVIPDVEEYILLSNGAAFNISGDQYFTNRESGYLTESHFDYVRVWTKNE